MTNRSRTRNARSGSEAEERVIVLRLTPDRLILEFPVPRPGVDLLDGPAEGPAEGLAEGLADGLADHFALMDYGQ